MDITTFASITAPLSADQARALGGEAAWSSRPPRRTAPPCGCAAPLRRRPTLFRSLFKATGLGAASARLLARAQREHRIGIQRRYPV